MDVRQIIEGAKYLNAKEKAMVAHCLISSLETRQDEGVDQAWAELAQKRFAELATILAILGSKWSLQSNNIK